VQGHEEEVLGKAYDARLMRRLLGYLRPYWRAVLVAFAAIVGGSLLQLALPYLMKVAIDDHIAAGSMEGLELLAVAFFGVLAGSFLLEFLQTWTLQNTGQRVMFDMRMQLYGHLQRIDVQYYDRNPVGRLMTRVTTDVDVLNELFTAGVVSVFGDIFLLVGIVVALAIMDWRLAAIAFTVLPLIALVTQWFRRNVRESYRNVRTWIARINAFLQEHITGMATVQLFRRERRTYEDFERVNRGHRDANIDSIHYYAVFYPAIEIIGAISTAMIIWFGGNWVLGGTLSVGSFVAFILYAQRFYRPISDLSEKFNMLQGAMAASERIFKLLDTAPTITGAAPSAADRAAAAAAGPRPVRSPSGHIRFEDVSFAYNGTDLVLKNVSFDVKPGQRVGIVGATGAGKSTIINLLLRFYDVTSGRILVDGTDIREMDLRQLRRLFSLVLQDVHLFSGTIASNIRLGERSIADEQVRTAAAAVHASGFVEALPAGYQTAVAERGATLSVGQKQLLSFARALAFDPRILVLDEATSSVDTDTELLIRDALHTLMSGRTTIAIAHRLSTIQDMDTILVLHHGQLREAGTHQELLARRGIYYKLYQLQYR